MDLLPFFASVFYFAGRYLLGAIKDEYREYRAFVGRETTTRNVSRSAAASPQGLAAVERPLLTKGS